MTSKFKVGDKFLRVADSTAFYTKGKTYTVKRVEDTKVFLTDNRAEHLGTHQWGESELLERFRLVEKVKPTKSQRITALENEVAELRPLKDTVSAMQERLEQLGVIVEKIRKPSTVVQEALANVENIIEFEGKQYKKVDREAREGDVVVFTKSAGRFVTAGKPYKVRGQFFTDNDGDEIYVYDGIAEGTSENVDVYELHSIPFDSLPDSPSTPNPKTANQLRAEIIEKAKKFVEKYGKQYGFYKQDNLYVAIHKTRDGIKNGYACCNPSDVFNEHIGKAIALGRTLGLDVSEFEQAVQPTLAVGQVVEFMGSTAKLISDNEWATSENGTARIGSYYAENGTIINDTNAIYGGVE